MDQTSSLVQYCGYFIASAMEYCRLVLSHWDVILAHHGLVMPYGNIELSQLWLR